VQASAAYIRQQAAFRRIEADSPMAAEPVGANATLTLRPTAWWSLTGVRQTLVDSPGPQPTVTRVTVSQIGSSVNGAGFRVIAALYHAQGSRAHNLGTSVSIGRALAPSIDIRADYFRSDPRNERPQSSVVVGLSERVSPRLSLLQTITRSDKQISVNVGGEFLSNPLRASVSYQTVYAPLRVGNPFVQVVGVDVRVNVFDRLALQAGTYATPRGQLRYTLSGSYIHSATNGGRDTGRSFALARYVVKGRVRDTDDRGVSGAVIYLDRTVVITNADGHFLLRSARAVRFDVRVCLEEFLAPGRFEIVSAPATVTAAADGHGSDVVITVRRP
jgi:hypothetical protein